MKFVYDDAKDLNVRAVYVYAKEDDAYAYADPGKTIKVASEDLGEWFEKGMLLINDGGVMCRPISYDVSSTVGTISYFKTTNTVVTLKSEEYTA